MSEWRPSVMVPLGSRLAPRYGETAIYEPDGIRITANGCLPGHEPAFGWRRTVLTGSDTTDNLHDVCLSCNNDIELFLKVARKLGQVEFGRQFAGPRSSYLSFILAEVRIALGFKPV